MRLAENNMNNKLIKDNFEAFWFEKDVMYIRIYKDKEVNLEDVKEMLGFQREQGVSADHYRIVHAEPHADLSKIAREYVQDNAPMVKAEAYILSNLSHKILFNLFVKLRRNTNPIKAFENLDDAIHWLKKQH